jgi:phosphate uptake regulator
MSLILMARSLERIADHANEHLRRSLLPGRGRRYPAPGAGLTRARCREKDFASPAGILTAAFRLKPEAA